MLEALEILSFFWILYIESLCTGRGIVYQIIHLYEYNLHLKWTHINIS